MSDVTVRRGMTVQDERGWHLVRSVTCSTPDDRKDAPIWVARCRDGRNVLLLDGGKLPERRVRRGVLTPDVAGTGLGWSADGSP